MWGLVILPLFSLPALPAPEPPPVDALDLHRFPPLAIVEEQLAWNVEYRCALKIRMELSPHRTDLGDAYGEAYGLWWIWDCLRVAHLGMRDWHQQLRALIGESAYHQGYMPPSVPLWRFRPID